MTEKEKTLAAWCPKCRKRKWREDVSDSARCKKCGAFIEFQELDAWIKDHAIIAVGKKLKKHFPKATFSRSVLREIVNVVQRISKEGA